jgi:hypothetical protein
MEGTTTKSHAQCFLAGKRAGAAGRLDVGVPRDARKGEVSPASIIARFINLPDIFFLLFTRKSNQNEMTVWSLVKNSKT